MSSPASSAGTPAWMVTFADLMALLVTFFVLLFSFSQVDVQKYNGLMDSIKKSLGVQLINTQNSLPGSSPGIINPDKLAQDSIHEELNRELEAEIRQNLITIQHEDGRHMIQFPDRLAFHSGDTEMTEQFLPVIRKLAQTLQNHADRIDEIMVAGHTDDVPIHTPRFTSNWDLSTARAVTVIHALQQHGHFNSSRIFAAGFADTHPVVANDSDEHRALNRRVEIHLLEKHQDHAIEHQHHEPEN